MIIIAIIAYNDENHYKHALKYIISRAQLFDIKKLYF